MGVTLLGTSGTPTDAEILRAKARLGLTDLWFLGNDLLQLGRDDVIPRPEEELKPIYSAVAAPRPASFDLVHGKNARWKRILCIPRFCAKTYILAVFYLQKILRNPNVQLVFFGNEKDDAIETANMVKAWLELPQIIELYGNHKSKRWSAANGIYSAYRDTPHKDPTIRTLGLNDADQGKRCDSVWWDDIIGKKNNNPDGIKKAEGAIASIVPVLRPGGDAWWSCTRYGPQDPASEGKTFTGELGLLAKVAAGETWQALPNRRGFLGAVAVEGDDLMFPGKKPGDLLFPSVWNKDTMAEARKEMRSQGLYYSQVLNEPRPAESVYFEEGSFGWFSAADPEGKQDVNPLLDGTLTLMSLDPASGEDQVQYGDHSVITVARFKWIDKLPLMYITRWFGGQWKAADALVQIMNTVDDVNPRKFFVETNTGGGWMMGPIERAFREAKIAVSRIHKFKRNQKNDKAVWIEEFSDAVANQQVFVEYHLRGSEAMDQTCQWSPGAAVHDDYPDSAAILWHWGASKRWMQNDGQKGQKWKRRAQRRGRPIYSSTGT